MNEEYSDMFSELSGHSGGNKYKSMAHVRFSFAGWTYEKWMDQQYTDRGEWIFLIFLFYFYFFGCSKHKSLGIKLHIAHSTYEDSWVQDKHKQNSNKGKVENRQNSQEDCYFKYVQIHICRRSYYRSTLQI